MPVSRIDLDGSGSGSPEGLVSKILKLEPSLSIPVPIERLCAQLDISSINYEQLDGIEGGLVTNTDREFGHILIKRGSHPYRQRFTIGHELGHFLIPTHMPSPDGRFLCTRADMLLQRAGEQDKRARMEVEANRFASLILIPPPLFRPKLRGNPSLEQLTALAAEFEVSKEAMARAYSAYSQDTIAFVVTQNKFVRRVYKHLKFPFVTIGAGTEVSRQSLVARTPNETRRTTELIECLADVWIDVERGKPAPKMFEQVMIQRSGFAMTMLWLESEEWKEDFDYEENMTSAQRYRDRMARFVR